MITREHLTEKRDLIQKSRAAYQAQIYSCDGALKLIEDLLQTITDQEQQNENEEQEGT